MFQNFNYFERKCPLPFFILTGEGHAVLLGHLRESPSAIVIKSSLPLGVLVFSKNDLKSSLVFENISLIVLNYAYGAKDFLGSLMN